MERCCTLTRPEPPRKTSVPHISAPLAGNGFDTTAASFEKSLVPLLAHLRDALSTQHEFFFEQRQKLLREELELLRQGRTQPCAAKTVEGNVPDPGHDAGECEDTLDTAAGTQSETAPEVALPVQEASADAAFDTEAGTSQEVAVQSQKIAAGRDAEMQTNNNDVAVDLSWTVSETMPLGKRPSQRSMFKSGAADGVSTMSQKTRQVRQATFINHAIPDSAHQALKTDRVRSTHAAGNWLEDVRLDMIFNTCMTAVVMSNVIVLGFQAGSSWTGWIYVDGLYFLAFAAELVFRTYRGGFRVFTWHSTEWRWMWFDLFLVVLTAAELVGAFVSIASNLPLTDNTFSRFTQLRILRVVRISRILKLSQMEFFKDLGLMVLGALGGLRTLMWAFLLILVPVYGVALFFTETLGKGQQEGVVELFSTMRMSMFTTFRCLVVGDCSAPDGTPIFLHVLDSFGWTYIVIYCLASVFMTFGLFNVIVAIYVESTMAVAKANDAVQRQRRLDDTVRLSCKLYELVLFIYEEFELGPIELCGDLHAALGAEMTLDEFKEVIENPTVRSLLHDCDVPEEDFAHLFEICDADGGGALSLDEIIAGVRKLRGIPRRSDVVWIMLRVQEVQNEVYGLHNKLDRLEALRMDVRQ